MGTALTVIIALLVFGFLIFIHEFGHYITARLFKVTIKEFSIGMGPKLVTYTSKKTQIDYSLGMFPIGGYVAMVGEDEESDDPNSFNKKPAWQRFIITAAGATVNIVAGFLAMIIIVACVDAKSGVYANTVYGGAVEAEKLAEMYGEQLDYELTADGDIVLLVSDGAVSSGYDWILSELDLYKSDDAEFLAKRIATEARRRRLDGFDDDITALCAIIKKGI